MAITLRAITMDNFAECIKLSVGEDQRDFVASNVYSLAEAKADGVSNPYAIYADDQMVGFIMYDFEPKENRGYISRLMIDARFQGQGHGREAMTRAIDCFKAIPKCHEIQTSYAPANTSAEHLYESLGFEQTGEVEDGEVVVRMHLA
ncbi:GNAT family N-acetyltransferase [Candidatus Bipolaricaulota bacterium]|nr:GNAT family N-acetyltransferase [Candidatus Bipolaricaulota bacterium]